MKMTPVKIEDLVDELDTTSRTPLYEQLAQGIQRGIASGEFPPGTPLPREQDIAAGLGISRQTVNQALNGLARRGLITRRRRVGTFVAEPYVEQPLENVYSFFRTLVAQGRQPSTEVLGYRVTIDTRASTLLTGQPNGLLLELQRLWLVDGERFAFDSIFLPHESAQSLPLERLIKEPLYDLLHEICGIETNRAEETLSPITVDDPEATLIGLMVGEAAFLVERIAYANDRPVEIRNSIIRGDRFRFRVNLSGSGNSRPD
jgi:GntR family transcriptional regulator